MSDYISVKPPVNLSTGEEYLFIPYLRYKLKPLKIMWLKNVFITGSGLCVNSKGLIKESHHDYLHQYDEYTADVEAHQQQIESDPQQLITLDDENIYLCIFHPWGTNYYHWLMEAIFRLWQVKDRLGEMILLLPEQYRQTDFIRSSLENFQFKSIYV